MRKKYWPGGSPGEVDGKTGCAGGVDERKRKSQGKHSWPQSRSSDGGSGSGRPLESILHSWFGGRNAGRRTVADNAGRCKGVLRGIDRGAGSDRSRNALGLDAGGDHRVGTRGAGGQPAVDGRVEASQAEERSHRCQQVGTIGAGGSAVVVPGSASQSRSAPGSGGAASPGRLGIGTDGGDPHHAMTGVKNGHTTSAG